MRNNGSPKLQVIKKKHVAIFSSNGVIQETQWFAGALLQGTGK